MSICVYDMVNTTGLMGMKVDMNFDMNFDMNSDMNFAMNLVMNSGSLVAMNLAMDFVRKFSNQLLTPGAGNPGRTCPIQISCPFSCPPPASDFIVINRTATAT